MEYFKFFLNLFDRRRVLLIVKNHRVRTLPWVGILAVTFIIMGLSAGQAAKNFEFPLAELLKKVPGVERVFSDRG
jgi:hypothetical protein